MNFQIFRQQETYGAQSLASENFITQILAFDL